MRGHAAPRDHSRATGRFALNLFAALAMTGTMTGAGASPAVAAAHAKYYFELHEVEAKVPLDGDVRSYAGEALRAELASRPEWQSDLGVKDRDAVIGELKKRKLSGFDLVVKIENLKKEIKDPNPGSRLRRVSVSVKLSVLGTTIPGEKIAFGGDGEAGAETEASETRMDAEAQSLTKDAIKDAIKQAIDQAVLKLGTPKSTPMNESHKRKPKKS